MGGKKDQVDMKCRFRETELILQAYVAGFEVRSPLKNEMVQISYRRTTVLGRNAYPQNVHK